MSSAAPEATVEVATAVEPPETVVAARAAVVERRAARVAAEALSTSADLRRNAASRAGVAAQASTGAGIGIPRTS
jgi:hypothetical protein